MASDFITRPLHGPYQIFLSMIFAQTRIFLKRITPIWLNGRCLPFWGNSCLYDVLRALIMIRNIFQGVVFIFVLLIIQKLLLSLDLHRGLLGRTRMLNRRLFLMPLILEICLVSSPADRGLLSRNPALMTVWFLMALLAIFDIFGLNYELWQWIWLYWHNYVRLFRTNNLFLWLWRTDDVKSGCWLLLLIFLLTHWDDLTGIDPGQTCSIFPNLNDLMPQFFIYSLICRRCGFQWLLGGSILQLFGFFKDQTALNWLWCSSHLLF